MGRREHDPVLRRRAIDLLESGKAVREVAEELGVSGQSIYTWRRQYRVDSGNFWRLGQSLNRIVTIAYYKEEQSVIHVSA